jgi:hypothetical protein
MSRPTCGSREALCAIVLGLATIIAVPAIAQDVARDSSDRAWTASAEIAAWILPDQADFVLVQISADHGGLHLEGRYNYEDLRTGSAWLGWSWTWGGKVPGAVTPMAGAVFGNTDGLAAGVELDLVLGPVEFYVESEYVFDLEDSAADYYYAWSELSLSPVDWISAGFVLQRTRIVERSSDVAAGPFLEGRAGPLGLTAYLLDPFGDERFGVIQLSLDF